jgi:UDP-N-acetylmuramoyl-tripeptide--D-alanyl-D-alanine ligase
VKQNVSLAFLHYLRILAKIQLHKIHLLNLILGKKTTIVGITGSAGKTSCLLACQAALTPQFNVKTNYGGNSESGIPLSILGLKVHDFSLPDWVRLSLLAPLSLLTNWNRYDVLLLEMGIDSAQKPKNMDYLLDIVKPDIGIFLNVSSVHAQNFDNLDHIAQEKAKLINTCSKAIINATDPLVKKYCTNRNQISLKPVSLQIPEHVLPPIYDITFGATYALANMLGLNSQQTKQNILANFHLSPGRSSLLKGIKQSQIIDSSYNSSPLAAIEMLKLLKSFPPPRIAILGDMRELGKSSATEHQSLYRYALTVTKNIISVGPETQKYFGPKTQKFLYWWQASEYLKSHPELISGSTILIKGSQNTIFLEELIKDLLLEPSDSTNLCRQSPYWLKTKASFYKNHV